MMSHVNDVNDVSDLSDAYRPIASHVILRLAKRAEGSHRLAPGTARSVHDPSPYARSLAVFAGSG
jgi:hypothetical protein